MRRRGIPSRRLGESNDGKEMRVSEKARQNETRRDASRTGSGKELTIASDAFRGRGIEGLS